MSTSDTADAQDRLVEEIADKVSGTVRARAPLGELTTLGVGGPARVLVTVESTADITAVARV